MSRRVTGSKDLRCWSSKQRAASRRHAGRNNQAAARHNRVSMFHERSASRKRPHTVYGAILQQHCRVVTFSVSLCGCWSCSRCQPFLSWATLHGWNFKNPVEVINGPLLMVSFFVPSILNSTSRNSFVHFILIVGIFIFLGTHHLNSCEKSYNQS